MREKFSSGTYNPKRTNKQAKHQPLIPNWPSSLTWGLNFGLWSRKKYTCILLTIRSRLINKNWFLLWEWKAKLDRRGLSNAGIFFTLNIICYVNIIIFRVSLVRERERDRQREREREREILTWVTQSICLNRSHICYTNLERIYIYIYILC